TASAPGHARLQLRMRTRFIRTQRIHEESTDRRLRYQRENAIFSHSWWRKCRGKSWNTPGAVALPDRSAGRGEMSESIFAITVVELRSSEFRRDRFPPGAFLPNGSHGSIERSPRTQPADRHRY